MATIEESIIVRAPLPAVFAAATDPRRAPEWSPRIIEVKNVSPYPPREGTTWEQTAGMGGQTATMRCRVGRFQPPNEGILEISGGGQQGHLTTRCTETPGGTRVTQSLEYQTPGGFKGRMMAAIAGPMVQRELSQALARMRDILEREAGGGDGSRTA